MDAATTWLGLEVLRSGPAADGRSGRVSFRARWSDGGTRDQGVLEEDSRFVRRAGRWYYADAL